MKKLFLLLILFILSSCISFNDKKKDDNILNKISGGNVIPENANTIQLKGFIENNSSDRGERLLLKIKELITTDGRLTVYNSKKSDLVLTGTITSFFIKGLTFDAAHRPLTKRIRITVSLKLFNRQKKKVIFIEENIQSYLNYSENTQPIKTDIQAEDEVIEMLAKRITKKVISGWYTEYMSKTERGEK